MQPELFALTASIGWAANGILVRKGARYGEVTSAVLLSFICTVCFLWGISWWTFPEGFSSSPALFYFLLSGLIQPALVRTLHYMGIARLGASRAEPLRSVAPLFATLIAFIVLNERPGVIVYTAIFLTITGMALLSYRREGEAKWKRSDLLFPLAAAFLAAISQNIRKAGLLILPNPYVAAAVTTTTSLVVFLSTLSLSGQSRSFQMSRSSFPFYGAAALVATAAQLLSFVALSRAEVSVVVTLTSTSPLFTVVLSGFFLRDLEKITAKVVIGAFLLVAGILLITNR